MSRSRRCSQRVHKGRLCALNRRSRQIRVAPTVASKRAAQPYWTMASRSRCCAVTSSGSRVASWGGGSSRVGSGGPSQYPCREHRYSWWVNSRRTGPPSWRAVQRGQARCARWRRLRQSGAGTRSSGSAKASPPAGCPVTAASRPARACTSPASVTRGPTRRCWRRSALDRPCTVARRCSQEASVSCCAGASGIGSRRQPFTPSPWPCPAGSAAGWSRVARRGRPGPGRVAAC